MCVSVNCRWLFFRIPAFLYISEATMSVDDAATQLPSSRRTITAKDGKLVFGTDPIPEFGGRNVLVRICATALNRADLLQAAGKYNPPAGASDVLGLEMAGEVVALGPECSLDYAVGDRVMALLASDGYSEFCAVDEQMLMRVPRNLNWHKAAGIPETWLTAYQLLFFVGKLEPGMSVLIHAGASGVGLAATQLAVDFGATVYVTTGSEAKIKRCVEMGATAGFNYKQGPFSTGVLEATDGRGVDMVLDCVGGSHAEQNAEVLCLDGIWVLFGAMGGVSIDGPIIGWLMKKRIRLEATTLRGRSLDYKIRLTQEFSSTCLHKFSALAGGGGGANLSDTKASDQSAMLAATTATTTSTTGEQQQQQDGFRVVIDRVFIGLQEMEKAHAHLASNQTIGKVVVHVSRH